MEESSLFDSILGLPVHPLVVHAAVVILPLSALGLILVVLIRPLRARFAELTVLGVLAGTAAAFVAKESGEALERHVGDPGVHAQYGDWAVIGGVVLSVLTVVWYVLQRRATSSSGLVKLTGALAVLAGIASLGLIVLVGHTGAEQAWKGTVNQTAAAESGDQGWGDAPAPAATSTPSATATAGTTDSGAAGYTLAQVSGHADRQSCWAAVDGSVYDLTGWVSQHPGGEQRILNLCGTDATQAFTAQHGGQARPARELAQFKIGTLQG